MLYAKISTDKTVTFGPVLAADGTMSSGALAYTDAVIFKNGVHAELNASATFTHHYEGVYELLLKAADLDAVGTFEVVLNKNPLAASPVKITVLAANVYDWLFGTTAPSTLTQTQVSGGAYDLTNATYTAALKTALGTVPASLAVGAIANDAITAAAIANGAIDAATFAAGAINAAAIAADAIELAKIKDGAISAAKFAANAITSTVVADNTITANKINADAITAAKIANGAIDNATFAADVGSTAYATNVIALAADKAIANAALATAAELLKVPKSDSNVTWNATALASINAEVDTALNTAIPGGPTANSVNERIATMDGLLLGTIQAGTHVAQSGDSYAIVNGDHGLVSIQDDVDAILADTNELELDWKDGGRLDLLLDGASAAGDPWLTLIPGSYTAGMAGYILGTNINATISSRGTSTHSAADVYTAFGTGANLTALASATNLATIAGYLDTEIAAILADTNELQTNQGNWLTATGFATATELAKVPKSDGTATWNNTALAAIQSECNDALVAYDPPTKAETDTAALTAWTTALTEAYPAYDATSITPAQALYAILQSVSDFAISGLNISVKNLAGTEAMKFTMDSATAPTLRYRVAP